MSQCHREMVSGRGVAVRPLDKVRDLQDECIRVLQETLLLPLLMYNSETDFEREGEV